MNYKKWMTWHNISSAFFLPLAMIFIITGALYMLDIRGETVRETVEFSGSTELLSDPPRLIEQLKKELPAEHLPLLDKQMENRRGSLVWGRFSSKHLTVSADREGNGLIVSVNRPSLFQTLMLAHMGKVDQLFVWFSVLFAAVLIFSYLSGVVLAFRCFRRMTIYTIAAGLVVTAIILWISV